MRMGHKGSLNISGQLVIATLWMLIVCILNLVLIRVLAIIGNSYKGRNRRIWGPQNPIGGVPPPVEIPTTSRIT